MRDWILLLLESSARRIYYWRPIGIHLLHLALSPVTQGQRARAFTPLPENIFLEETSGAQAVPCRSGGGSALSSSPTCARSGRGSAAHFRTARDRGSRAGIAPCAKPSPALRAPTSQPARNPPPIRSAPGENPAATGISPCPSSSAPKCRALSPALRARRGRFPSTRQTQAPASRPWRLR